MNSFLFRVPSILIFSLIALLLACGSGKKGTGGGGSTHQAALVRANILGQISSGMSHSCALTAQGRVLCWGEGDNGRLGNGDSSHGDKDHPVTVVVGEDGTTPLEGIVQISAGGTHTCALTVLGRVLCWGEGANGRLGNDDSTGVDQEQPVTVVKTEGSTAPLKDIVQISAGGTHTCALTSQGGVVCWGEGSSGELGNGSSLQSDAPVGVVASADGTKLLGEIIQISSGDAHTCALTAQKSVVCWGDGGNARLGNDDSLNEDKNYPVAVVAADGEVGLLQDIVQVGSGRSHSCAVTSLGRAVCWGLGLDGQLGNDNFVANSVPISVIENDGSTNPLEDIVQVSLGYFHTCALTSQGQVKCWGRGSSGQLGNDGTDNREYPVAVVENDGSGSFLNKMLQVSSGGEHTCALSIGGKVVCWGKGDDGRLGDGASSSQDHPVAVVDGNGSNRSLRLGIHKRIWGCYSDSTCRQFDSIELYKNDGGGVWGQIRSGGKHTCALASSGTVWCWGGGGYGQLGNDDTNNKDHPVIVVEASGSTNPLTDIVQISAGEYHTCALTSQKTVQCWGLGLNGQLGNDATVDKDYPVTVVETSGSTNPLTDIVQISSKKNHVCGVNAWGRVVCWGQGTSGELGNSASVNTSHPVEVAAVDGEAGLLEDVIQVSTGSSHTCALTAHGEVLCWGKGDDGQLGSRDTENKNHPIHVMEKEGSTRFLSGIVQISSGADHTCAVNFQGQVVCWGKGGDGRLGNNSTDNEHYPVTVMGGEGQGAPLKNVIRVSAGYEHTCALKSSGGVTCWGKGGSGRLGNYDLSSANKNYPVVVVAQEGSSDPLKNIIEISSAREHTCVLSSSGEVLCWGSGTDGRLGNDGADNKYAPVAVVDGDRRKWSLRLGVYERPWACYRDGTCQELPEIGYYQNDGSGVLSQVAIGGGHTCALTSSGEVRCWGYGASGQLGNDGIASKDHPVAVVDGDGSTTALTNIVQISLGEEHGCALTSRGEVLCWGKGSKGRLGNNDSATKDHPVAVELGDTSPLSDIVQIGAGSEHVCALTSSREVWCWGRGTSGRLGNNDVLNGDKDHAVAVVDGDGSTTPLKDIVQIASGGNHTCALTDGGEVLCWGGGGDGQLGNDDIVSKNYPVTVVETNKSATPLKGIVQISSGEFHTCALTGAGEVLCWGNMAGGRLGDNVISNDGRGYPVAVVDGDGSTTPLKNIVQIVAGKQHSCALTSSGEIRCWGKGENGRLGNDTFNNTNYPVTVVDGNGSTNPLGNIVQIGAGFGDHTCALASTGQMVCWGKGDNGRLGHDADSNREYPVTVVDGDGSTSALNLGIKKHSWACYKDGSCQQMLPTDSYSY